MSAFNGKWFLVAGENVEALQNAIKAPAEYIAKLKLIAEGVKTNPQTYIEEVFVDKAAGVAKRTVYVNGEKKREGEAKLGVEQDAKITDGRAAKTKVTLEADNKLVRVEKGDGFELITTIEVNGDDMTATMIGGGVTGVEKFKRVK